MGWAATAQSAYLEDFENETPFDAQDLCSAGNEYTPSDANWSLGPACEVLTAGTPKLVDVAGDTYLEFNREYPAGSEVWNAAALDVSSAASAQVSFDLRSAGTMDAGGGNIDELDIYAVLDGVQAASPLFSITGHVDGGNSSPATASFSGSVDVSAASSLSLRMVVKLTGNDERYQLDDVSMCADNNGDGQCTACDDDLAFDADLSDYTVQCISDLPADCDMSVMANRGTTACIMGEQRSVRTSCVGTTAEGTGEDGAIVLFDVDGDPNDDRYFVPTAEGITLTQFENGVAQITGQVHQTDNENAILNINIVYDQGVSGADWDGGFKHAQNCAITSDITDAWNIYILNPGLSYMTGEGDMEGTLLTLNHAPSSEYFGFQVGEMANDRNCNEGAGGWFSYSGQINGQAIQGAQGDVLLDVNCNTGSVDPCAEDGPSVTLIYTAIDVACGDALTVEQTVSRDDTTDPTFDNAPADMTVACADGEPAVATVTASDNCEGDDGEPVVTYQGQSPQYDIQCTGSYKIDRTWTAEDCSGNEISHTQTITVQDLVAPTIAGGEDYLAECDGAGNADELATFLSTQGGATATDDCGTVTWSHDYEDGDLSDDCGATGSVDVTFTATDDCGNASSIELTFTIQDTGAPTLTADAMAEVDCAAYDSEGIYAASASDLCGDAEVVLVSVNEVSSSCAGSFIHTYKAVDDCGNESATYDQVVNLIDTEAPAVTITCPADADLLADANCFADVSVAALGTATFTATDNCDDELSTVLSHNDVQVDGCAGSYTITRTWTITATDHCGLTSSASCDQIIEVSDETNPTIDMAAANETVECDGAGNLAALNAWLDDNGGAEASDNCTAELTWTNNFVELSDLCGATGAATVTFTATDDCGNASSTTATFTIEDTTAPSIDTMASNQTVECDGAGNLDALNAWIDSHGGAAASDICGGVTWTNDFEGLSDLCGATGAATVTFTATDDCGNFSTTSATFTIEDTMAPTWNSYDVYSNAACEDLLDPTDPTLVPISADDVCGGVTYSIEAYQLSGGCPGTWMRVWTATDDCGNASETTEQYVQLYDIIAPTPVITCPADYTVDADAMCEADVTTAAAGMATATATDNCDDDVDIVITHTDGESTSLCDGQYSFTRTFTATATDDCDNVTAVSCDQLITVEDNTAPTIDTLAMDMTVECDGAGNTEALAAWLADNGGATASDNCSDITWTHSDATLSDLCAATGAVTVTFTATDDCGNFSTTSATFTIEDTTAPAFTGDFEVNISCDDWACDADALEALGAFSIDEACGDYTLEASCVAFSGGCVTPVGAYQANYTATDECGNVSTFSQIVILSDEVKPVPAIECPEDITLEADADCMADLDPSNTGMAMGSATDNCDAAPEVVVTYMDGPITDICAGSYSFTRTFTATATDHCDNEDSITCDQLITVTDVTAPDAPMIAGPADAEVFLDADCSTDASPAITGEATATADDNCDADPSIEITYSDSDPVYTCTEFDAGSVEYSFFRTHFGTGDQSEYGRGAEDAATLDAMTDPSNPATTFLESGEGDMDLLLNWTSRSQLVNAGYTPPTAYWSWVMTADFTASETGTYVFTIEGDDGCDLFIDGQAVAAHYGRHPISSLGTHTGTIDLTAGETLELRARGQEWQGGEGMRVFWRKPSETTGWSQDAAELGLMDGDGNAQGSYTFVRTWSATATDDCENEGATSTYEQLITVTDNLAPTWDGSANTYSIACDEYSDSDMYDVMAADNCDSDVVLTIVSNEEVSGSCAGSILRTYQAVDDCGNMSTFQQAIDLTDEVNPVVTISCPANADLFADASCGADVSVAALGTATFTATDNCDNALTTELTHSDSDPVYTCSGSYSFTRTWTISAEDHCENEASISCDQLITVTDNTAPDAPTLDCADDIEVFLTADCSADITTAITGETTATTADNCDAAPAIEVTFADAAAVYTCTGDDDAIEGSHTVLRTWSATATDDCGNASSTTTCEQLITVTDNTAPSFDGSSNVFSIACDDYSDADLYEVQAADNCDSDVAITILSNQEVSGSCAGSILRTYQAIDDCGNVTEFQQTINLTDDVDPVVTISCPSDANLNADALCMADTSIAALGNATFTATDNCDGDLDLNLSHEDVLTAGCAGSYTIVRTFTITAEDHCENMASASCTQTITVSDVTAPSIDTLAMDMTVECDGMGNVAQYLAWQADNGGAVATDNCSDITWSSETIEAGDDCGGTVGYSIVTFTAADDCGNESTTTATFTIEDTTPPALTGDLETSVACDAYNAETYYGNFAASDICSGDVTVVISDMEVSGPCAGTVMRTYTATDACNNVSTFNQIINLTDDVDPTFDIVCPADVTLSADENCNADTSEATHGTATYENLDDNCDDAVEVSISSSDAVSYPCDGSMVITRTFTITAEDHCGNTTEHTCDQTITVNDDTNPSITAPADVTVECDGMGNQAALEAFLGGATASDNCSEVTIEHDYTALSDDCGATGSATVTFTATDACGNASSASATFTIEDTTAPSLSIEGPANQDLEQNATCDIDTSVDALGTVSYEAGDDCGSASVEITHVDGDALFTCTGDDDMLEGSYTFVRTFTVTATDECGLTTTLTYDQTITVSDNLAPVFTDTEGVANGDVQSVCCESHLGEVTIPDAVAPAYMDNCDSDVAYAMTETYVGDYAPTADVDLFCLSTTPAAFEDGETCNGYDPHSLRLFGLAGAAEFYVAAGPGLVANNADGTLTLTQSVMATDGSNGGFDLVITYGAALDWAAWSSQSFPTGYKRDCGDLIDDHLNWEYRILESGTLTGTGDYAGSSLSLAHAPSNNYYACQFGLGANNMNNEYGYSGWFTYNGTFDGNMVMGSGDAFGDLDCCLPWSIEREYSLVDDCANESGFAYSVSVNGDDCDGAVDGPAVSGQADGDHAPVVLGGAGDVMTGKTPIRVTNLQPNPTNDISQLGFMVDQNMRIRVDLVGMDGALVSELYDGIAQSGVNHTLDIDAGTLTNGMYQIRLSSSAYLVVKKLLVSE